MSNDDDRWDVAPRPKAKRERRRREQPVQTSPAAGPDRDGPSDRWSFPTRGGAAPQPRRLLPPAAPATQILTLAMVGAAVALVAVAFVARPAPDVDAERALPPRPIVARVVLAAGDTRSLTEVCAAYDVPYALCELSRTCAPASGSATAPGGGRVMRLILRSSNRSCGAEVDPPKAVRTRSKPSAG